MFGKHKEPLTSSERMKRKRNLAIYKSAQQSNNICMDVSKNIKNVVNYETYMNVVDGYYESRKEDISNNRNCFNVQLTGNDVEFRIKTFDDVNNSFIDFKNASNTISGNGLGKFSTWNSSNNAFERPTTGDGSTNNEGFVVHANDISGTSVTNFLTQGTIEKASDIIYPYIKKGVCSNLIVPKLTFFDPSGNLGKQSARDVKRYFPMSNLSHYPNLCNSNN